MRTYRVAAIIASMIGFFTLFTAHGQSVIVKWANWNQVSLVYGDMIKVRPMVPYNNLSGSFTTFNTVIFDENKENNFTEPVFGGRKLYSRFIDSDEGSPGNMENVIPLYKTAITAPQAVLNFTTEKTVQSQLTDFAFGYGLYFICIDTPLDYCASPPKVGWKRYIVPIDFRDSHYPYGGDITIEATLSQPTQGCPNESDVSITVNGNSFNKNGTVFDPVIMYDLFQAGSPGYEFTIVNSLNSGLTQGTMVDPASGQNRLYLTHPAKIEEQVFSVSDLGSDPSFIIIPEIQILGGHTFSTTLTVYVDGFPEFKYPSGSVSSSLFNFLVQGNADNRVIFRNWTTNPGDPYGPPSGLVFKDATETDYGTKLRAFFNYTDLILGNPIQHYGNSSSFTKFLAMDHCGIYPTGLSSQIGGKFTRNCGVYMKNVRAEIKNTTFAGLRNDPQTGLIAQGMCVKSIINNCTFNALGGHGMEFIDLGPKTKAPATDYFTIADTYIEDNMLYGAFLRGGSTNPYFDHNIITRNGYVNQGAVQSQMHDGVNIYQAFGTFQNNDFFENAAYGVHASNSAYPAGWDQRYSGQGQLASTVGNNCFKENFFNLGGNYSAPSPWIISFGQGLSPSKGDFNSFIDPRDRTTYNQVTMDNKSVAHLNHNRWKNHYYPQNPKKMHVVNGAIVESKDDITGTTRCVTSFTNEDIDYTITGTHQDIVDVILAAENDQDWSVVRDKSLLLLSLSPDPHEVTIAASALVKSCVATREEGTTMDNIVDSLYWYAHNSESVNIRTTTGFALIHLWDIYGMYDSSVAYADRLASTYPPDNPVWKAAFIHNAFALYDYYDDRTTAKVYLDSLLKYYSDAEVIGAYYSILAVLPDVVFEKRGRISEGTMLPSSVTLSAIFPNPSRVSSQVEFSLPETGEITLEVLDIMGRRVSSVLHGEYSAGTHSAMLNHSNLKPGSYFYRLRTSSGYITRPFIITR